MQGGNGRALIRWHLNASLEIPNANKIFFLKIWALAFKGEQAVSAMFSRFQCMSRTNYALSPKNLSRPHKSNCTLSSSFGAYSDRENFQLGSHAFRLVHSSWYQDPKSVRVAFSRFPRSVYFRRRVLVSSFLNCSDPRFAVELWKAQPSISNCRRKFVSIIARFERRNEQTRSSKRENGRPRKFGSNILWAFTLVLGKSSLSI